MLRSFSHESLEKHLVQSCAKTLPTPCGLIEPLSTLTDVEIRSSVVASASATVLVRVLYDRETKHLQRRVAQTHVFSRFRMLFIYRQPREHSVVLAGWVGEWVDW